MPGTGGAAKIEEAASVAYRRDHGIGVLGIASETINEVLIFVWIFFFFFCSPSGMCKKSYKCIFQTYLTIDILSTFCEIDYMWVPQNHIDSMSILWFRECRQATSHSMSQCWPRSMLPYAITRPQWDKKLINICHSSIQLSCSDTCQILMWFAEFHILFCNIRYIQMQKLTVWWSLRQWHHALIRISILTIVRVKQG